MDDFSPHNSDYPNDSYVKVRRGKVESVDLYEIKDSELDILEQGTPATLQLNFAIFFVFYCIYFNRSPCNSYIQ